jgi:hypothetical protein
MQPAYFPDVQSFAVKIRPELLAALAVLSERRQAEVLDFARFLGQFAEKNTPAEVTPEARIALRLAPSATLRRLTGLVALSGDALVDSGSSTASSMKPSERVSSPHLRVLLTPAPCPLPPLHREMMGR